MGKFEKSFIVFTLLYIVGYSIFFFNAMSNLDNFQKILPFHFLGMILSLSFIVIVIRDILKRTFKNPNSKVMWSLLIIMFWPSVFIYLPKYGFKPRDQVVDSKSDKKYVIGFVVLFVLFFGFICYSMFSAFSSFDEQDQSLTSLIYYGKNDEILERFEKGLISEEEMQGEDNWSPLHTAVSNNRISIVKIFIDKGIDINLQYKCNGNTPLHLASEKGYYGIAKLLIEAGADKTILNSKNQTPLDLAITGEYTETANLLSN